jgi:hypothetical protein
MVCKSRVFDPAHPNTKNCAYVYVGRYFAKGGILTVRFAALTVARFARGEFTGLSA